jgi:hypothetical protein
MALRDRQKISTQKETFKKKGGYSLIGKTAILHIVILGSSPNISIYLLLSLRAKNKMYYNAALCFIFFIKKYCNTSLVMR